jgi:hypothetical protein
MITLTTARNRKSNNRTRKLPLKTYSLHPIPYTLSL